MGEEDLIKEKPDWMLSKLELLKRTKNRNKLY